jgi:predicted negative regulator of RcsB-dependent stress response
MAYDLEEQEQLAALRGWWKDNGTKLLAVLVIVALVASGWQGWRLWQASQAAQAGELYDTVAKAIVANDAKALRDATGSLAEGFPRSPYASMGALAAARYFFEKGDLKGARAQLQWVVDHASTDELREIGRLRLAAVMLDDKAYDEALAQLAAKHGAALEGQYAALKGDVLVAKNQPAEAKAAYKLALDKTAPKDAAFRASVQLRLDALGG